MTLSANIIHHFAVPLQDTPGHCALKSRDHASSFSLSCSREHAFSRLTSFFFAPVTSHFLNAFCPLFHVPLYLSIARLAFYRECDTFTRCDESFKSVQQRWTLFFCFSSRVTICIMTSIFFSQKQNIALLSKSVLF